jgi:tetratricopeptide (TPR) repeat protein
MSNAEKRKERLHKLVDLALAYCSATKTSLACQFERDRKHLYPDTDNPKLDLIIALAEALEWPLDAVVEIIREGDGAPAPAEGDGDYESLNAEAMAALKRGEYARMVELAREMGGLASSGHDRGRACRLEGIGWDGQGRYTQALAAFRRGLEVAPLPLTERLALRANLANAHYSLWDLASAEGIAHLLVSHFDRHPPAARTDRGSQAFAHFVRGNALRRLLSVQPEDALDLAGRALADLERAERLYLDFVSDFGAEYLRGIVNTCRGGAWELQVELGRMKPQHALAQIEEALGKVGGDEPWPEGDWLESYGWWCDFGANIALRHLHGRELQRTIAVLSNKLLEIARRLQNWALIERAVSMDYVCAQQVSAETGVDVPHVLDVEDLKLVTGTIGRFPRFRHAGWRLIETAAVVPTPKRN